MQGNGIRPMGDRVLVERLDGDGREEVLASGLILPARDVTLRQGNSERIPDTFRARVIAVGDGARKATQGEIVEGAEVLVHTYDQRPDQTLVGESTPFGLLVLVDDILGVVDTTPITDGPDLDARKLLSAALMTPAAREYLGANNPRLAQALDSAPMLGMIRKDNNHGVRADSDSQDAAVSNLGFYRRGIG